MAVVRIGWRVAVRYGQWMLHAYWAAVVVFATQQDGRHRPIVLKDVSCLVSRRQDKYEMATLVHHFVTWRMEVEDSLTITTTGFFLDCLFPMIDVMKGVR